MSNSISDKELVKLKKWLENERNIKVFKSYLTNEYDINSIFCDEDLDLAYTKVWRDISNKEKPKRLKFLNVYKYTAAASILIIISLAFFFNKKRISTNNIAPVIVNNQIQTGTDKATLTLESGEEITLSKGNVFKTQNATSNGEKIVYNEDSNKKSVYNILTVPRGGQFQVTLPDGTEVWLNSESKIKYPINFIAGNDRQVELIYGEAYFDVSPSTNHKGSKFSVLHNLQTIDVLGTEFNVKAYKDESNSYTTLVEGKIAWSIEDKRKVLLPTEQANFDRLTNNITVTTVDVYEAISWKHGVFNFKRKPLKDIMKVLSRWYDIDVVFKDKNIEDLKFIGTLYRRQSIEDIMFSIKNTNLINNYEINNKTITLY